MLASGRFALAALILMSGCRADIAGSWEGHLGADPAQMDLDQEGALITGWLCVADRCDPFDGELVDDQLEAWFGCPACDLPSATLDLRLRGGRLAGQAIVDPCDAEASDCRLAATFERQR